MAKKPKKPKKPHGRPPHEPTQLNRDIITMARGMGMIMTEVEDYIGISTETINKHYQHELAHGKVICDLRVSNAFMKGITACDASLIKFYMTNKMGFVDGKSSLKLGPDKDAVDAFDKMLAYLDGRSVGLPKVIDHEPG